MHRSLSTATLGLALFLSTCFLCSTAEATQRGTASYAVEDLNLDGIPDLITASFDGKVSIALGNEDGSFTSGNQIEVEGQPVGIASGEINRDSWPDLVIWSEFLRGNPSDNQQSSSTAQLVVLLGNGQNSFDLSSAKYLDVEQAFSFPVGTGRPILALRNVNGNRLMDLIVSFYGSNCSNQEYGAAAFELDIEGNVSTIGLPDTTIPELTYPEELVTAATYEPRLTEQMQNPYFVTELYLLGMTYASLGISTASNSTHDALNFFPDTVWKTHSCETDAWQKAGREIHEFIQEVNDSARLLKFARLLIETAKGVPDLSEEVKDPIFLNEFVGLGQAYAALDPQPSTNAEDAGFFLDTLWRAAGERTRQR
ncbi:MAG TPA: VCBS repeat-containing protein [Coleofasciculaceae cyanobacterium]|jgi:hypothetical protein